MSTGSAGFLKGYKIQRHGERVGALGALLGDAVGLVVLAEHVVRTPETLVVPHDTMSEV